MAISNYPVIINGTYDLYTVPPTSGSDTTPNESAKVFIGCMKEGFKMNWSASIHDVKTNCIGETVIDGVYTGIEDASISMMVHEWDSKRTAVEPLLWPTTTGFGDVEDIGKMVNYSKMATMLMAVPRTGTPAATNTLAWYFYACHMKGGDDFSANFDYEDQVVPIVLKCYPVINEDTITSNKIYAWSDDTSAETLANFTVRYWRRSPVV